MNLEKEILKRQSRLQCKKIIKWTGSSALRFRQLMELFFKGDYRLTQHAAWPMSYCIQNHPALAIPYFKKFLDRLTDNHAHPAVRRNIVRLLQFVEIPERYHGKLMDLCFQFINNPEEAIAVKAFSLAILSNLSNLYPEILPEIKMIIEARWETESPAFKSQAKKILNKV